MSDTNHDAHGSTGSSSPAPPLTPDVAADAAAPAAADASASPAVDAHALGHSVAELFGAKDITTHVAVEGTHRTAASYVRAGADRVSRATTVQEAGMAAETTATRWRESGLFSDVQWNLEPLAVDPPALAAAGGKDRNLVVKFNVKEKRVGWNIGLMTSATAVPELNCSVSNLLGRPWSASLVYLPSLAAVPSGELKLSSLFPAVGQRCDYIIGRRIETRLTSNRPCPIADSETVTEAKVVVASDSPVESPVANTVTVGLQDRTLGARDSSEMPGALARLFGSDSKLFARWHTRYSSASFHEHPRYRAMYGLPVGGFTATNRVELFSADREQRSAAEGVPVLGRTFLKHELQVSKFVKLLPAAVLDLNFTFGTVFPLQSFLNAHSRGDGEVGACAEPPLADRLFASWRHVRGYRALGPNTVDEYARLHNAGEAGENVPAKPKVFRALGGDTMWAASAVLNVPFLPYPENGIFATHLFANVGSVRRFGSVASLVDGWKGLFTSDNVSASVGGGVVVTAVPGLFSAIGAGRLEANWAFPLRLRNGAFEQADDLLAAGATGLFEQIKWGLHWTSLEA